MKHLSELMTHSPYSLSEFANVFKARKLLAEHKIRHIPIVSSEYGKIVGLLSQKRILRNAIQIIDKRGMDQLEHMEKSMSVSDIMNNEPNVVDLSTSPLEVARMLKQTKNGCVLVEDQGKLVGIVTSSDFVDLAISVLAEKD